MMIEDNGGMSFEVSRYSI